MISLDHVLLLEQKVESAVAKIAQLQAENDALRSRCSELTNALSTKSEQLSSFESDQNKIESGILKALDRLNSIENSVLKASGQAAASNQPQASQPQVHTNPQTVQNPVRQTVSTNQINQMHQAQIKPQPSVSTPVQPQVHTQSPIINASEPSEDNIPGFFDLENSEPQNDSQFSQDNSTDNGQFDIF